jgi:uncharacterized protein (AIM24 family)
MHCFRFCEITVYCAHATGNKHCERESNAMEVHVQHRASYALAVAQLEPNETIQVEAGSMVGMSAGESFTVDTGHLVPFSDRLGFKVRSVGGLKSTLSAARGWSWISPGLVGAGRRHAARTLS